MASSKIVAVLTGDLIRSTELDAQGLAGARRVFGRAVQTIEGWKSRLVRGEPEFFRGDSWQLLLADPAWALRAAIYIRARMRSDSRADTRVAIGIGDVESVSRSRVSLSTGEAFVLSGHALDSLTLYSAMTVSLPSSTPAAEWIKTTLDFSDALIRQWTKRQAEICSHALDPADPTHEDIAKKLKPRVSKQTVTKALAGANWRPIRRAIQLFESSDWSELTR